MVYSMRRIPGKSAGRTELQTTRSERAHFSIGFMTFAVEYVALVCILTDELTIRNRIQNSTDLQHR